MWIVFNDRCESRLQLSETDLKHFPQLQEVCEYAQPVAEPFNEFQIQLNTDKKAFVDLLFVYRNANQSSAETLTQTLISDAEPGYLSRLFVLHDYFGNENEQVQAYFLLLFEQILRNADDSEARHVLGL